MMNTTKFFRVALPLIGCLLLGNPAWCADDTMINLPPAKGHAQTFAPGTVLHIPDGRQTIILEQLPNGDFMTDLNLVISPEGIIRDGPLKGQTAVIDPAFQDNPAPIPEVAEEEHSVVPENKTAPDLPKTVPPVVVEPPAVAQVKEPEKREAPQETPKTALAIPKKEEDSGQLTLAQMIPLTPVPDKKADTPQGEKATPQKAEPQKAQQPKHEHKKEEQKKPVKPETPKKENPAKKPASPKIAPGQELRIPQEAINKGSLDFLEGCWQGTRPEYYSKRTIKECFCFGAAGKNGKRRIYDGNKRMCVGASKATLSKSGVLSVTSSGAACNDGERWGSAEMVCRNNGPKTPCSWVFRDANNGRQSYTIPFIKVESCGR